MSTSSQQLVDTETTATFREKRWCPPKPRVGLQLVEKVLNRHTVVSCSESRLVVAVLARVIHDCLCLSNRRQRREARRFILGVSLKSWCDLVGLEAHFVRFVASKAGYLAAEDKHWQQVPIRVQATPDQTPTGSRAPKHTLTVHRTGEPAHA